jgi:hypothetical protein
MCAVSDREKEREMIMARYIIGYFAGIATWNVIAGPFFIEHQWWSDSTRMWMAMLSMSGISVGAIIYLATRD